MSINQTPKLIPKVLWITTEQTQEGLNKMKYELKEINLIINTGSITTTWAETKYLLKIFGK